MSVGHDRPGEGRVLLLPATRRDGEAVRACLERESIECLVCTSAQQVADEVDRGAGALVLTDSALAGAGGSLIVQTLQRQPQWSDLPVVLLAKPETSLDTKRLIGRMTNVILLERPASTRTLLSAIRTGLRARVRQYQMRDQVVALREAENALRQSDRRKDEFLAMLAHELRNPLAPIRTASDLLPCIIPPGDERVDSTLRVVKRQVKQLARLVDDLLDVSRITQGRIQLERQVLDMSAIVEQALESVEPQMSAKGHQVLREMSPVPLHVRGDNARLVQCVSNVLSNAAKYTDGPGTISVALEQQGEFAVLSIQDDGIGIPAQTLPKIFDLFVQSERSLDRAQGGLGIGLSVVRRLIEMHQGVVTASSGGAGKGSRFEIRLPVVSAPVSPLPEPHAGSGRPRRVLLVDDNRDAAESLSLLLEFHGHEVRVAYGGEEALAMSSVFAADLVLLDIGLPVMDGYEVARQLRRRGTSARLVALTGYGQPEDLLRAKEAGFDAHMVKPVEFRQVLEALDD